LTIEAINVFDLTLKLNKCNFTQTYCPEPNNFFCKCY